MASRSTRHRIALVIALAGLAVSAVILYEEMALARTPGHSAFCTLGGVVNCDIVLGSRYGRFLDVPLGVWGLVVFGAGALAAVPGAFLGVTGGLADLALIALASGALGYAIVLAAVMALVIGYLCLLCLALDAVVVAWFVTVLPIARAFPALAGKRFLQRRAAAYAIAGVAATAAVASGAVTAVYTPSPVHTAAEVTARAPEFARGYLARPTVAADSLVRDDAATKGDAAAPVTIVEFSDFQCPACGQAYRDLHDVVAQRRDVRLVFRNFPLDPACNDSVSGTGHRDACLAAIAAECARRQGKFWEYHDRLFENQRTLDRDNLFRFGRELGLDITTFRTCLDDPAVRARVVEDVRAGIAAGVESTPTLFVNGRRIDGALERPYYDYALVLEREHGAGTPRRP
jgi:protein-disulfide isomerase